MALSCYWERESYLRRWLIQIGFEMANRLSRSPLKTRILLFAPYAAVAVGLVCLALGVKLSAPVAILYAVIVAIMFYVSVTLRR